MYRHLFEHGGYAELPAGKVVCVGRNYAEHIAELNNETPDEPLLFMKGSNALVSFSDTLFIPTNALCHNEIELAFLIAQPITCASVEQAHAAIAGVGLALDLTLRDKQSELRAKGLPWERAKAFDGSCPVSAFIPSEQLDLQRDMNFSFWVNDELRQQGCSSQMIWSWSSLIAHISTIFSLYPGDVVLTGTPKGVGPLNPGDKLKASLNDILFCSAQVQQEESR
ncbi:fumarylacetoacetate hydrolase family protein [Planctobacterium marinum]|uniref:Acylpyruvase n=1 Tax=Planctobacterium marinum TaxID=1631968 RepID=A0AA48HIT6_9ALTE|nr:acylpyruvase [Planctobacterium marinum]